VYEKTVRQPGQPTAAEWQYVNPDEKQPLQFHLDVKGEQGSLAKITLEFDNYIQIDIPAEVKPGQKLVCDGSQTLRIYDAKGRQIKTLKPPSQPPKIPTGPHQVQMAAEFTGDPAPKAQFRFKTKARPTPIKTPKP